MEKLKASEETVLRFMNAVYPGYGELALASKSEAETLMDATSELLRLRARCALLEKVATAARKIPNRWSPELEAALAAIRAK